MLAQMSEPPPIAVREPSEADRAWLGQQLRESWGSTILISRGHAHDATKCPALIAVQGDARVGLATFRFDRDECELLTIDALEKRAGIGSALLAGVIQIARTRGCGRLWLITSNDNLDAMRFYQRRGMSMVAVHRGAVDEARRMKPSIPEVGEHGIPLHDELEFELLLERR